jgi:hypothetical protein
LGLNRDTTLESIINNLLAESDKAIYGVWLIELRKILKRAVELGKLKLDDDVEKNKIIINKLINLAQKQAECEFKNIVVEKNKIKKNCNNLKLKNDNIFPVSSCFSENTGKIINKNFLTNNDESEVILNNACSTIDDCDYEYDGTEVFDFTKSSKEVEEAVLEGLDDSVTSIAEFYIMNDDLF